MYNRNKFMLSMHCIGATYRKIKNMYEYAVFISLNPFQGIALLIFLTLTIIGIPVSADVISGRV